MARDPQELNKWRAVFGLVAGLLASVVWFLFGCPPLFGGTAQSFFMAWFCQWSIRIFNRTKIVVEHCINWRMRYEKTVNTFKNNIMFWVSIIYPGASFSTFRTLICREIADTSSTRLISPLTLAKGARTSMARLTVWISGAV